MTWLAFAFRLLSVVRIVDKVISSVHVAHTHAPVTGSANSRESVAYPDSLLLLIYPQDFHEPPPRTCTHQIPCLRRGLACSVSSEFNCFSALEMPNSRDLINTVIFLFAHPFLLHPFIYCHVPLRFPFFFFLFVNPIQYNTYFYNLYDNRWVKILS